MSPELRTAGTEGYFAFHSNQVWKIPESDYSQIWKRVFFTLGMSMI